MASRTGSRRFLVEVYTARFRPEEAEAAAERAHAAATELTEEGIPVRHIDSIYVPEDETCFHLFEAHSAEDVGEASRRASLEAMRIVEAHDRVGRRPCDLTSRERR
jgi:hypothetical protein